MKNLKIISEVLETTKVKLKYNSKLEDFIWDSMSQIKLLTIKQMKILFPGCKIYLDKFIGLNKSIVAYSIN